MNKTLDDAMLDIEKAKAVNRQYGIEGLIS